MYTANISKLTDELIESIHDIRKIEPSDKVASEEKEPEATPITVELAQELRKVASEIRKMASEKLTYEDLVTYIKEFGNE